MDRKHLKSFFASMLVIAGCSTSTNTATTTSTPASSSNSGTISNPEDMSVLVFDDTSWNYDETNDVYYRIGVSYAAYSVASDYESLGIYVPGAYMNRSDNGNGTYTYTINSEGTVNGYTASTAPIVMPINTAGYSAQAAPTEYNYDGISDYLEAGFIYVYSGARGRANGENSDGTSFAAVLLGELRILRRRLDI